ncbi:hypothetical protein PFICI_10507 [Pestalotiopsis fici W106-1]|uniref:Uncharacterized protein n=1 Tax=Pestalotiopsis fici (strain W106-1 / CGMCC3.15140) TaxID=1229662 RepID=W3WX68_PESFW|nr:uncharacterized protein PFICI_10507 [Pestalotiopsis fici W106-1]ETS78445.1 hypothetical protein PFICI_10507 [Pestalotiopsis fici W106-1]
MSVTSELDTASTCPGFEGNSDLYGLGIRIGVYLQWYSTWLCITVDPETSGETHTANALFIFAIMVALLQAMSNQSINNVEAYLMLQICFGYLLTLLSIFGLRLQLLHPYRAQRIMSSMLSFFARRNEESSQSKSLISIENIDMESATSIGMLPSLVKILGGLADHQVTLRLSELNNLKEGTLSWFGVFWRISIATIVVITNAILVFNSVYPPLPTDGLCRGHGFVFMFTTWELSGSRLVFLQVVAVAIAVVFGLIASIIVTTSNQLILFLEALAVSDFILWIFKTVVPTKLRGPILTGIYRFFFMVSQALKSMQDPTSIYQPGQAVSLYALFSSGARFGNTEKLVVPKDTSRNSTPKGWVVVTSLWHAWIVGATIWFIVSVELNIRWNKITGVHTIESTGQLIPFVVGVASFIRAKHKLIVLIIKKQFPDWEKLDLEITFIRTTPVSFQIVEIEEKPKPSNLRATNLPGTCTI